MSFLSKVSKMLSDEPTLAIELRRDAAARGGGIAGDVKVRDFDPNKVAEAVMWATVAQNGQPLATKALEVANRASFSRWLRVNLPAQLPAGTPLSVTVSLQLGSEVFHSEPVFVNVMPDLTPQELLHMHPGLQDVSSVDGLREAIDDLEVNWSTAGAYTAVKPTLAAVLVRHGMPLTSRAASSWTLIAAATGVTAEDVETVRTMYRTWPIGARERFACHDCLAEVLRQWPDFKQEFVDPIQNDEDKARFLASLRMLKRGKPPWYDDYVNEAVADTSRPQSRAGAVYSLQHQIENPQVRDQLFQHTTENDPEIVVAAMKALNLVFHHEPVDRLIASYEWLWQHPSEKVREQVVRELHWLPSSVDPRHEAILLSAEHDPDPRVRSVLKTAVFNHKRRSPEVEALHERLGR